MKNFKKIAILSVGILCTACGAVKPGDSSINISSEPASSNITPTLSSVDNRTKVVENLDTYDLNGEHRDQSMFKGKLTLLNMWGTYCDPCIVEMPYLAYCHKKYSQYGFQVVGIVIDVQDSSGKVVASQKKKADNIIAQTGVTYTSLLTCSALIPFLNSTEYVPYSVFIDENGYQLENSITGAMSMRDWDEKIDSMIMKYIF